jgi:hypothetical protein|nr:hypothetical protein [uncultured bacterium]
MNSHQPGTKPSGEHVPISECEKIDINSHGCSITMMFPNTGDNNLRFSAAEILISMFEQQTGNGE